MLEIWNDLFTVNIRRDCRRMVGGGVCTCEVYDSLVCAVVSTAVVIIPLDAKPYSWLVGHGADITDGTNLAFER